MDRYLALYNCHLIEIFREKLLRITGENLHYCWINKVLVLMHTVLLNSAMLMLLFYHVLEKLAFACRVVKIFGSDGYLIL